MYCIHTPCILCAKIIANAKIRRHVTYGDYSDKEFLKLFKDTGIEFIKRRRPKKTINFLD